MIGGTYYVTAGSVWSWDAVLIGLVYAFGPTSVLFGKHIDKLKEDKKKRVNTLPVIIGEKAARYTNISMWIVQFLLVFSLILAGKLTFAMLIVLFALPKLFWAIRIFAKPRPDSEPEDLDKGVWPLYLSAHAFVYNRRFGGLFLIGLILDIVFFKNGWLML